MTDENTVSIETTKPSLNIATQGQRFLTVLLDAVFYITACFCLGFVAALFGFGDFVLSMTENENLFTFVTFVIYYTIQEVAYGQTIGKRIMKTKVVNEDGSAISVGQALVRSICRYIPFEAFSFLGDKGKPIGWHDSIAKTRVISLKQL